MVLGLVLGILLSRNKRLSTWILGVLGVIQTIPSLALLGFLLPLMGIGFFPAVFALFLYGLLPIVRNTFIGISEVDMYVKESAKAMGMTDRHILWQIDLPLALPTIFAGIRTAAVIGVGVATLCSLIGAGGLGELIFRGIALNNAQMIWAGAIPSAGLALGLDAALAFLQKNIQRFFKPILGVFAFGIILWIGFVSFPRQDIFIFKAGFDHEFAERADGYKGLAKHYQIQFSIQTAEFDASLMYEALKNGQVDMIGGYSTDGRIDAFDLLVLEDDKAYFPPYYAVPLVRQEILQKYPFLENVFAKIANQISDIEMRKMNFEIDDLKKSPQEVATAFLKNKGFQTNTRRKGKGNIKIGGKKFTEQYILTEILKQIIENNSSLTVEIIDGLGGTQIAWEALKAGEIDMYPEYTGTAFLTILQPDAKLQEEIIRDKEKVLLYVRKNLFEKYQIQTLAPLGFNNSYALMMRKIDTKRLHIQTISDLKDYLENHR